MVFLNTLLSGWAL